MESKTKNRKTREQITQMVERAFSGITLANSDDAIRTLDEGWFNAAYDLRLADGREVILKIAPLKDAEVLAYEKDIMTTEVATMRLVRENPAIPVPEIYYVDTARDICDSDYCFMEKLTGDNYGPVKASLSPAMQEAIDRQIGTICREINSFTGPHFGYAGNSDLCGDAWKETFIKIVDAVLEDGYRKQANYGYTSGEVHDAVLKHASSLEAVTTPQLIHWDAWDRNFFVKKGKVTGIIDFERALWADPLMESIFRALAFGGISDMMRGYGKTTFTHEELERCHLYTLYLALVMNIECYYREYDSDDASNLSKQLIATTLNWLKEN
ncbi:phosphotransferase family protein [Ktedonospora formicarum]|uniref:Aminoglycoside phosphotransferase n=1 Tax=Ktedonospora formicarum TaxID=2778364 RepID=A0A8J3IDZ8_9CHLR|nr:phosphotransferase [Ktedonospora formicarum]GHO51022.1 aminoglycoside phosphotransferase [Ktedonospora formicarum]